MKKFLETLIRKIIFLKASFRSEVMTIKEGIKDLIFLIKMRKYNKVKPVKKLEQIFMADQECQKIANDEFHISIK